MFIQINDLNVHYQIYGSGMPIVMIHGWGPDHRMMKGCMEPVFENAYGDFKRIYFDLPGMGLTKGSKLIDSSDKMLELIIQFIEAIIPGERFILVGKSYGGYLARGLVRHFSDKVKGLFLLCPMGILERQRANLPPFEVLEKEEALEELLTEEEKLDFKSINVVQTKKVWERYKENILPGLKLADNNYLNNILGQSVPFRANVDDPHRKYFFPTLILTGRQDCCEGYTDQWLFLEVYRRASFVVLDKAGHNLEIEQPEVFNALVREWLERIRFYMSEEG
jgi:pimeloyl-ACP methyl ester carboxylesterase